MTGLYVDSHVAYPALARDDQQMFRSVRRLVITLCARHRRCAAVRQHSFTLSVRETRDTRPGERRTTGHQGKRPRATDRVSCRKRVGKYRLYLETFFARVCDRLSSRARACVCFQTCTGETRRSHTVRAPTSNNTTGYDVSDVTMTSCPCKRLTLTTLREPVTLNGRIKTTAPASRLSAKIKRKKITLVVILFCPSTGRTSC